LLSPDAGFSMSRELSINRVRQKGYFSKTFHASSECRGPWPKMMWLTTDLSSYAAGVGPICSMTTHWNAPGGPVLPVLAGRSKKPISLAGLVDFVAFLCHSRLRRVVEKADASLAMATSLPPGTCVCGERAASMWQEARILCGCSPRPGPGRFR